MKSSGPDRTSARMTHRWDDKLLRSNEFRGVRHEQSAPQSTVDTGTYTLRRGRAAIQVGVLQTDAGQRDFGRDEGSC